MEVGTLFATKQSIEISKKDDPTPSFSRLLQDEQPERR